MRDYDPTTGRYIQGDPLGLVDGASVYGYALQSPGMNVEPRGEAAFVYPVVQGAITYGPTIARIGIGLARGAASLFSRRQVGSVVAATKAVSNAVPNDGETTAEGVEECAEEKPYAGQTPDDRP